MRCRGRLGLGDSRDSDLLLLGDRSGHRCLARSGLGLAERLENKASVGWHIGNRLEGGPGSLESRNWGSNLGGGPAQIESVKFSVKVK